jgi:diguanylate cyclase (GGDEF)-like protein/PAS domain S-box-containing protein
LAYSPNRGWVKGNTVKRFAPHLFVLCIVGATVALGINESLRTTLEDLRTSATHRAATGDIVLVAIDPRALEKVGVWPWPRTLHAEIIGKLEKAGAQDIIFDVDFSATSTKLADDAFGAALEANGGSVVLPSFKQRSGDGSLHINQPLERFRQRTWTALVNVTPDKDGVVRRYPYGDTIEGEALPSMAALLAGRQSITGGSFSIDYGISPNTVRTISYVDVLDERPEALAALRNKRVIIGGTALELGDRFNIPHGKIISGPMLQVLAAESIAQGRDLHRLSGWYSAAGLGVLVILMGLVWARLSSGWRASIPLCVALAAELGAGAVQSMAPFIVDTSLIHVASIAYLLAIALHEIDFGRLLNSVAEKRFNRMAMALGDGLVCASADGSITLWNPGAEKIFGYAAGEVIGQPLQMLFQDDGSRPLSGMTQEDLQSAGGKAIEINGQRKNGEVFPLEASFSGWQGTDDFQYGVLLRDVSARVREAERIRYLAEFDTLTSLANRHSFAEKFSVEIKRGRDMALFYIDLDNFKNINDVQGHGCGDRILAVVGQRLSALCAEEDIIARLGGDEFAIVLVGNDAPARIEDVASNVKTSLAQVYDITLGRTLDVGASIGIAVYPRDGKDTEELLSNADLALYEAKGHGRGQHVIFEHAFRERLEGRLSLNAELKNALKRNEFELFYQPQISLRDNKVVGAEALIRWRHPRRGLLPPGEFMAAINASEISQDVAFWVLRQACSQASKWQDQGHNLRIGVNLSPSQLRSGDLADVVAKTLTDTGLLACNLELEVTEDIVLADEQKALACFQKIQELGVQLAFDDFGTGYGSLSYLRKFPLNVLKIDKSFVFGLVSSPADMAIVRTMISLGSELGLSVIAEGIEDDATAELLRRMGCQEAQGYLFGRPMPAAEFEQRLLEENFNTAAVA